MKTATNHNFWNTCLRIRRLWLLSFVFLVVGSLATFSIVSATGQEQGTSADSVPNTANASSSTNYWPQQLGNYWIFSLKGFDGIEVINWSLNFRGKSTGINASPKLNCTSTQINRMMNAVNTKTAWVVYPSSGLNRFVSSRYVAFYKESEVAYHGPKYCNLSPDPPNSWNLQWYMNNPVYDSASNNRWIGSQGGMRMNRSTTNLVQNSDIAQYGNFPKSLTLYNGNGRYPKTTSHYDTSQNKWIPDNPSQTGLPGYSYLPLSSIPYQANTVNAVVPDFVYDFGMGYGPTHTEFAWRMSTYMNMSFTGKLTWNLEYLDLQAADILSQQSLGSTGIPATAKVLGVIFFEPNYKNEPALVENDEIPCEAYYFVPNVGPVKVSHSIVSVLPNDPTLSKTRQLCYYLYRNEINKSQARKGQPYVTFTDLAGYMSGIQANYYSYPVNSMELVAYKIYADPSADSYGFDSPTEASLMDAPQPNSQIYIKNGKYWIYTPNGLLYSEGSIQTAWLGKAYPCSINGATVYPWSNNGPDGLEYGADLLTNTGRKGIVINDGCYWLHNPGDSLPGPFYEYGRVSDYFPGYSARFGNDTNNLSISGTGIGQILLVKDGYYMYYRKVNGAMQLGQQGYLYELSGWSTSSPTVSGVHPIVPDAMMYGAVLNQSYNELPGYPIPSAQQLIVFQKGAIWVRYGISGPWETWNGQLR